MYACKGTIPTTSEQDTLILEALLLKSQLGHNQIMGLA